jgi:hypothetical protein
MKPPMPNRKQGRLDFRLEIESGAVYTIFIFVKPLLMLLQVGLWGGRMFDSKIPWHHESNSQKENGIIIILLLL